MKTFSNYLSLSTVALGGVLSLAAVSQVDAAQQQATQRQNSIIFIAHKNQDSQCKQAPENASFTYVYDFSTHKTMLTPASNSAYSSIKEVSYIKTAYATDFVDVLVPKNDSKVPVYVHIQIQPKQSQGTGNYWYHIPNSQDMSCKGTVIMRTLEIAK